MKRLAFCIAAAALLAGCGGGDGRAVDARRGGTVVLVDGSSTVFPISEALGEEFQGARNGSRVTVGLSGTGGGFRKFCRGEIDIAGASRPIEADEMQLCRANGVSFVELPVALDGLAVVVNPRNTWADCMSIAELRRVWEPRAQGRVTDWSQVRAGFPSAPLRLFGAGADSGTFDYFTAAVNGEEGASRGDYTATEDDNITVTGVRGDAGGLGYMGLAYLRDNGGTVRAVPIRAPDGACVAPTSATVRDGSYRPLSRPLFYYVNRERADRSPPVQAFVEFAFDAARAAPLVDEVGYVPLPDRLYGLARAKFQARRTGTDFGGRARVGATMEEIERDASPTAPSAEGSTAAAPADATR